MKPIIGITSNSKEINCRYNNSIDCDYVKAVNRAGGIGIIFPIITDEELLNNYIQIVDGLLFSGGGDINPLYYDEEPIEQIGNICLERDIFELGLFKRAYKKNLPMMGICRGMQLINVALGGSLYQDIKTQIKESIEHRSKETIIDKPHHGVKIIEGTMLSSILAEKEIEVNSFHHQSLKDIGKGLKITAYSGDGVVEGIVSEENVFLLGMQWHPERLIDKYPIFNNIFDAFIKACIKKI